MPTVAEAVEEIHLELRNGRHSKQYHVYLEEEPSASGWRCRSEYGAIGAPLKAGSGSAGTSYEGAKAVYDKLVREKTQKPCSCCGAVYVETGGDQPTPPNRPVAITRPRLEGEAFEEYRAVALPESVVHPSFFPELLTPITPDEVGRYIVDDRYELEEKLDGHRVSISCIGAHTTAYNRLGEHIPVPSDVLREVAGKINIHLDGEYVKGRYIAYDVLSYDGVDLRDTPRRTRRRILGAALKENGVNIEAIKTFVGREQKEAALLRFQKNGAEGVVFKDSGGKVMPGRQGVSKKLKFWASATVRVCRKKKEDGHHSFAMEVLRDNGEWVEIGRAKCKGTLPAEGSYREVKYLYLTGTDGRLYQPEDLGERSDVSDMDCLFSKLKIKDGGSHGEV